MTKRFVAPPNWPSPPPGWKPPAGWRPDPHWGPAPRGWQFWQEEQGRSWFARHKVAITIAALPIALLVGTFGLAPLGLASDTTPATIAAPASATGEPPQPQPAQTTASTPASTDAAKDAAKEEAAKVKAAKEKAAKLRAAKEKAAKVKAAKEKAAKVEAREKAAEAKAARESAEREAAEQEAKEAELDNCTPGYSPCLPPASDYDCSGGSGNGPEFVSGPVKVSGLDPYDLDRDGDGTGCDS